MWQETESKIAIKNGMQPTGDVTIYIPERSAEYAPEAAAKDLIVKGMCVFEFDNATLKTVSESFAEFRKHTKFFAVKSIECKMYGSVLRHIKIIAR